MNKSERNFAKCLIMNARWNAGSMDKSKRLKLLKGMIEKGYLTPACNLNVKGFTAYHESM